jgi:hypothetical protein
MKMGMTASSPNHKHELPKKENAASKPNNQPTMTPLALKHSSTRFLPSAKKKTHPKNKKR